ncbi:unnamed protein product [Rotaria socialis]|uniref:Uncharacterized protein n=1 Tax=Rotaria socialis TaxID=392032 RepID=A0A821EAW7_9BILA|nr:unnamed protein product [Rotaria socialis]CAF4633562.1 unnamed protein product [Rotaria socialis]CAF4810066.1 unnamed protein product [Rotaria socialis]
MLIIFVTETFPPKVLWLDDPENESRLTYNILHGITPFVIYLTNISHLIDMLNDQVSPEANFVVLVYRNDLENLLEALCSCNYVDRIYVFLQSHIIELSETRRTFIGTFAKVVSILQQAEILIHAVLWDFAACFFQLGDWFQAKGNTQMANDRYRYAVYCYSVIRNYLKRKIESLQSL